MLEYSLPHDRVLHSPSEYFYMAAWFIVTEADAIVADAALVAVVPGAAC